MTTAAAPRLAGVDEAATINTGDFSLTQRVVGLASELLAMVAIVGEAGLGKTFAVSSAVKKLDLEVVTLDSEMRSLIRPMFSRLLGAITGIPHTDEIRTLRETLREVLAEEPRLIVLDEAQRLTHVVIEELRSLHDDPSTRFGLVFVGGHGCWEVLARYPMLESRIIANVQFRPLAAKDVLKVIPAYHPLYCDLDPELILLIDETFAHGVFRKWFQFTKLAVLLCEKNRIDKLDGDVIRNVFRLHGDLSA